MKASFNIVELSRKHLLNPFKNLPITKTSFNMFTLASKAVAFSLLLNMVSAFSFFTQLEIDNHPCKAENLKHTNRYICDSEGKVICQSGWKEPEIRNPETELNPFAILPKTNNSAGFLFIDCTASYSKCC